MSWLFWVLLVVLFLFGIQGFRKGLMKTILSMVSTIAVILITSWLAPQIGAYIYENISTESMRERVESVVQEGLGEVTDVEIPVTTQVEFIENLPVPQIMKDILIENNNSEMYELFDVDGFVEYLSNYILRGILNGISFVLAFIITLILMRVVLYAVNFVTDLPLIGTMDRLAGFVIGLIHGVFWIVVLFLVIALISDTSVGSMLMETIKEDPMLAWVYDKNALVEILMKIKS